MRRLAGRLSDRRFAMFVIVLTGVVAVLSAFLARDIQHEDDLLAFLPTDNPDIVRFRELNRAFGGLDVALIGIESDDALQPDRLRAVQRLTETLSDMPELDHVLSLTNVRDFEPDPMGGIREAPLIENIPETLEDREALRARVLSRKHVVGNLISKDASSLLIYAFPTFGTDARTIAAHIQETAVKTLPGESLHFGGAPFVSAYIYNTTQADMRRLTPWAVLTIVVVLLIAFRNIWAVFLGLFNTSIGILVVYATMAVLGLRLNVVLGALPVILFAVGSAYSIHMLARYSVYRLDRGVSEAVQKTVSQTGPVVLTAGLTTAAGLGSFVVMDITPLQQFGALTALGVSVTLLLSVTFVPAVLTLSSSRPHALGVGRTAHSFARAVSVWTQQRTWPKALLVLALGTSLVFALQVDSRVDNRAFYNTGSPPDLADRFMREQFGGSEFVQIEVRGDLKDAHALRAIRDFADSLSLLDGVDRVQHIGDVIATVNDAMEGQPRIPDNSLQASLLYGFLTGNPAIEQLVSQDRTHGLIHVRLSASDVDEVATTLAAIEAAVEASAPERWVLSDAADDQSRAVLYSRVTDRIVSLMGSDDPNRRRSIQAALAQPTPPASASEVTAGIQRWLTTSEAPIQLSTVEASAVADILGVEASEEPETDFTALAPQVHQRLTEVGSTHSMLDVEDLLWSVGTPLEELLRDQKANQRADTILEALGATAESAPAGVPSAAQRRDIAAATIDLDLPEFAQPSDASEPLLQFAVSGTPVLHRGLSQSTRNNQRNSLLFALVTIVCVLSVRFRNPLSGLLAAAPTGAALLAVWGGMGLSGIRLDIGTSMLASIVIGAGVDYGVHLLSAWWGRAHEPPSEAARRATARVGGAIWTNALAVAAGFFVLTLGEARPLQNVGGLTAAAMLIAAACTFLVIPLFARRQRYHLQAESHDPADPTSPEDSP